jgi:predicted phage terminase large subunit-like protein
MGPNVLVDAILEKMRRHRPLCWFGEEDMIGRALGPVLRDRMGKQGIATALTPLPAIGSKQARAANIQALMSLGRVRFPSFAPWWEAARQELIKFPAFAHDDFVDFMSLVGRGMDCVLGGRAVTRRVEDGPRDLTGAWLLAEIEKARAKPGRVRHYCSL